MQLPPRDGDIEEGFEGWEQGAFYPAGATDGAEGKWQVITTLESGQGVLKYQLAKLSPKHANGPGVSRITDLGFDSAISPGISRSRRKPLSGIKAVTDPQSLEARQVCFARDFGYKGREKLIYFQSWTRSSLSLLWTGILQVFDPTPGLTASSEGSSQSNCLDLGRILPMSNWFTIFTNAELCSLSAAAWLPPQRDLAAREKPAWASFGKGKVDQPSKESRSGTQTHLKKYRCTRLRGL